MKTAVLPEEEFLYQQISESFEKQIMSELLKAGDKLPSVRALSREQGISISTAYLAYVQLETKGLIEARPRSGYYVRFSPRLLPEQPSPVERKKQPSATSVEEMIAQIYENMSDEEIMRFSLAAPPVELLPAAKLSKTMAEAIRRSSNSCLAYEDIAGNLQLRKQVARQARSWGGNIRPDDVVITQGCMEALVFALKTVTQPGDIVAIQSPTYFGIFNVMRSLGLHALEIPQHPETGPDLEYLEKATGKISVSAVLFVTNFNNPDGATMPDERKKQLVQLLEKKDIPLIEDDIYGELYFGKKRPLTCKHFDRKGNVLLCSSVSKTLAPGYRVGWCLPGRFREKVMRVKLMHSISSASPTQAAIGLFFEAGRFDLHMRHLRKALHVQCLRYTQAVAGYFPEGTKISRPVGGYVLWIELPGKINAFELYQAAMLHKISIAPGQIFSVHASHSQFIRVSFGMPWTPAIDKSLRILGNLAKGLL
ncbi:MAG: GntR family transcriptional regulator [Bacteroidetes bacterium]|nr:MAG: GntR family transcriptional regulator [Bacteroidota bacterium]